MPHLPRFPKPNRPASRPLAWLGTYPLAALTALFVVGMAFPFLLRHESEWEDVYVRAANHLRAGESVYNPNEGFVYPPFLAAFAIPFAALPQPVERLGWYLANVGCLLLLCRWSWRLAGGGALQGTRPVARGEWLAYALGLACGFRYVVDGLAHQQTDLLIGALVLGGCRLLSRSRAFLAATCFGVAAGAKCTPLLWCGYLLWRGRWRAAGLLVCVAVGVNLIPDLIHRPPGGGLWATTWLRGYLLPLAGADYLPGRWYSEIVYNQSLSGAVNRWFATDWAWTETGFTVFDRPGAPSPTTLKALLYGVEAAVVAGVLFAFGRRRTYGAITPEDARRGRESLEYGAVLLLMLLLSPMSSKPHFCAVLLPAFYLARRAVSGRDRTSLAWLLAAAAVGAVGIKGLWGGEVAAAALWFGNVMWGAVFLLAGCGRALGQEKRGNVTETALARAA